MGTRWPETCWATYKGEINIILKVTSSWSLYPHLLQFIMLYTITIRNFIVPTCWVWAVILFRETGVVHRITYSLVTSLYCYLHHTLTRRHSHWTASFRYPLLTSSHLNLSPPPYRQRSRIYADGLTYNACHEPSVTDFSNPKKQLY